MRWGVFKENGIPDEIAKEMAEWLEALNKNGAEEKNTFSSLTDERNEFIFQLYFQVKDCLPILATEDSDRKKREYEDGEARRSVQNWLQKEKNHFMELDAIRKTIHRHYHTWLEKNTAWCEEKLKEYNLFVKVLEKVRAIGKVKDKKEGFLSTKQAAQDFVLSVCQHNPSSFPAGTRASLELQSEVYRLIIRELFWEESAKLEG